MLHREDLPKKLLIKFVRITLCPCTTDDPWGHGTFDFPCGKYAKNEGWGNQGTGIKHKE
jgi:hypothetical protein